MSENGDAVLSYEDGESSFSGFSDTENIPPTLLEDEIPHIGATVTVGDADVKSKKKGKKVKSCVTLVKKPTGKKPDTQIPGGSGQSVTKKKPKKRKNPLDNLSPDDLIDLRKKLGIFEDKSIPSLQGRPNLHVEVNADDISEYDEVDDPSVYPPFIAAPYPAANETLSQDIMKAMFGEDSVSEKESDGEWSMPKLKTLEKDKAISSSLAALINTACTSQCDTDAFLSKHKVPQNCEKLLPPSINHEVFKIIDRRGRSQDKYLVDIQNLVAMGLVPIIKLVDLLKGSLSAIPEAKSLFSEAITILGQVQYNISLRRRYLIRPHLNKKYSNLCNHNMPVSTLLFGDEVAKEVKNCDLGLSLGKYDYRAYNSRGRSAYRFSGRRAQARYRPYQQGYQNQNNFNPGYYSRPRGNFYSMGRRGARGARTATVTSPNE